MAERNLRTAESTDCAVVGSEAPTGPINRIHPLVRYPGGLDRTGIGIQFDRSPGPNRQVPEYDHFRQWTGVASKVGTGLPTALDRSNPLLVDTLGARILHRRRVLLELCMPLRVAQLRITAVRAGNQ